MSETITITNEDILEDIKLQCKIPEYIEQIIKYKIIDKTAIELGIKVETEELQNAADKFRLINKLENATDTWEWLEHYNLSIDDFEKLLYNNLLKKKLIQHLFGDKIEPYFFGHQLNYDSAVMYEIILDDEDLALELYYAIKEGEISFYDVARKYIQDKELNRNCGYLGKVNRQDITPEISTVVFAANPPQLLKPIVTSKGLHIIFVDELIQAKPNTKVLTDITDVMFSEWLKKQLEQVELVVDIA